MEKSKLATKLNKNIQKGRFLSDAWFARKEAIAKRVARKAEVNRQKSAKRWSIRKEIAKRFGVNPRRVILQGEGVEAHIMK